MRAAGNRLRSASNTGVVQTRSPMLSRRMTRKPARVSDGIKLFARSRIGRPQNSGRQRGEEVEHHPVGHAELPGADADRSRERRSGHQDRYGARDGIDARDELE